MGLAGSAIVDPVSFLPFRLSVRFCIFGDHKITTMQDDAKSQYLENIQTYSYKLDKLKITGKQLSFLRLGVFLLALILTYFFAVSNSWAGIFFSLLISLSLFLYLIRRHGNIFHKIKLHQALKTINELEKKALDGDFSKFDSGNEYLDSTHPFSADLDIFGEASLFQFLNRSASLAGKSRLADKLENLDTNPASILEHQQIIQALSPLVEWRQKFQAIGLMYAEKKTDRENILSWVKRPPAFQSAVFIPLLFIIPIVSLTIIILTVIGQIPPQVFFLYLFIPWGIAGSHIKKVNSIHQRLSKTTEMLKKYSLLLQQIEVLDIQSPFIKALQLKLMVNNQNSSRHMKRLSAILSALDNRLNPISWAIFNALGLWDIFQVRRLERWQKNHQKSIEEWFRVLAETDALSSFANYSFNHPGAIVPEILSGDFSVQALELGHPLIHESVRVTNDFSIQSKNFTIITGASMAGKSTYLRTVGINLILAMCGAPICAKAYSFVPINIFSSIRTHDSLYKNESYFYAELKRLQRIIQELQNGHKLFVILDEILKGTNSKDKHAGSEALIKQLLTYDAGGIIATHDVSLGMLATQFPNQVNTRCFEVDIKNDELIFDYKMREGISKNMNATLLMKKMGITI